MERCLLGPASCFFVLINSVLLNLLCVWILVYNASSHSDFSGDLVKHLAPLLGDVKTWPTPLYPLSLVMSRLDPHHCIHSPWWCQHLIHTTVSTLPGDVNTWPTPLYPLSLVMSTLDPHHCIHSPWWCQHWTHTTVPTLPGDVNTTHTTVPTLLGDVNTWPTPQGGEPIPSNNQLRYACTESVHLFFFISFLFPFPSTQHFSLSPEY